MTIQFARGSTAAVATFVPADGQPVFDNTLGRLYVGWGGSKVLIGFPPFGSDGALQAIDAVTGTFVAANAVYDPGPDTLTVGAKLIAAGVFQIVATGVAGYWLKADADGNASWAAPAADVADPLSNANADLYTALTALLASLRAAGVLV